MVPSSQYFCQFMSLYYPANLALPFLWNISLYLQDYCKITEIARLLKLPCLLSLVCNRGRKDTEMHASLWTLKKKNSLSHKISSYITENFLAEVFSQVPSFKHILDNICGKKIFNT